MRTRRFSARAGGFTLGPILLLAGCGGGGFGESVSVPQARRTAVRAAAAGETHLALPEDQPFGVADAERHSRGSGQSDSDALPAGTGRCRAAVADKGSAWAEFVVGHVIHSEGDAPIEAHVTFDCAFATAIEDGGVLLRAPDLLALKVYVQDSNRRMLHKVVLAEQSDALGAARRTGRESPTFTFTMQPGMAYNLVAAGRVEVTAAEDGTPLAAEIELSELHINIITKPAPPAS